MKRFIIVDDRTLERVVTSPDADGFDQHKDAEEAVFALLRGSHAKQTLVIAERVATYWRDGERILAGSMKE